MHRLPAQLNISLPRPHFAPLLIRLFIFHRWGGIKARGREWSSFTQGRSQKWKLQVDFCTVLFFYFPICLSLSISSYLRTFLYLSVTSSISVYLYICLFIHPFIVPFLQFSLYSSLPLSISPSVHLSLYSLVHLFIFSYLHLSISSPIHFSSNSFLPLPFSPPVHFSTYPSLQLSIPPSPYLSVSIYLNLTFSLSLLHLAKSFTCPLLRSSYLHLDTPCAKDSTKSFPNHRPATDWNTEKGKKRRKEKTVSLPT